ncbi:hypothetical protein CB1_000207014 [Camelus ferus]|nr:hypothetical protein CB1_000207014 [Camelus ferus]
MGLIRGIWVGRDKSVFRPHPPSVTITVIIYKGKPVNMTKATVNYCQEKTHMMSAVDRSFTDQSTLQEDEWLGLSFMDAQGYSPRGGLLGGFSKDLAGKVSVKLLTAMTMQVDK